MIRCLDQADRQRKRNSPKCRKLRRRCVAIGPHHLTSEKWQSVAGFWERGEMVRVLTDLLFKYLNSAIYALKKCVQIIIHILLAANPPPTTTVSDTVCQGCAMNNAWLQRFIKLILCYIRLKRSF